MLRRSSFAAGIKAEELTADTLPQLTAWLSAQEKPLEEAYFAARQNTAALHRDQAVKRAELDAVSGGKDGSTPRRCRHPGAGCRECGTQEPGHAAGCEIFAVSY